MSTIAGVVNLQIPQYREGTFVPNLVPKGLRRIGPLVEMIFSLYPGGMTVQNIACHPEAAAGTQLSHDTIPEITYDVLAEAAAWQERSLEELYPIF